MLLRLYINCNIWICIHVCSSVVEDCEEAFVKNPDGHPLVLYLRTAEDHNLTGPTRQLLERVNAADKAAKVKVCVQLWPKGKGFVFIAFKVVILYFIGC